MKKDKLDNVFSELVRIRANWTCECCGRYLGHQKELLHCAHIVRRAVKKTRVYPDNAFSLCFVCHRHFTDNPGAFKDFCILMLGEDKYYHLQRYANSIGKQTKAELEDLYQHYKKELSRIEDLRAQYKKQRIEFTVLI
jgi:hypothetical protein